MPVAGSRAGREGTARCGAGSAGAHPKSGVRRRPTADVPEGGCRLPSAESGHRGRAPEPAASRWAGCPAALPTWAELGCEAAEAWTGPPGWRRVRAPARWQLLAISAPSLAAGHCPGRPRGERGLEGPRTNAKVALGAWVTVPRRTARRAAAAGGGAVPPDASPSAAPAFRLASASQGRLVTSARAPGQSPGGSHPALLTPPPGRPPSSPRSLFWGPLPTPGALPSNAEPSVPRWISWGGDRTGRHVGRVLPKVSMVINGHPAADAAAAPFAAPGLAI